MTAVLVTGGAGYIGSHACKALAAAGFQPVVYDNLSYGHRSAVRWGPLEIGDIGDGERLRQVIRQYDISAVMHFAAFTSVRESAIDPGKYYRNNVVGTLTLLEAMRDCGIRHMVFSSTCATYGIPELVPIPETAPQRPINPYGESKLIAERMLATFEAAYGLRWAALRYFNAAGADPDGEIGEDHSPETHLIPLVLDVALGRRDNITVFGRNYDTPDGTCIRDYIHVSDLAEAHILALRRVMEHDASFALNLGTGEGLSVAEVIEAARRITERPITVAEGKRREGDPPVLVSDTTLSSVLLGWRSHRSDLDSLIGDAWRWHKRRFKDGT